MILFAQATGKVGRCQGFAFQIVIFMIQLLSSLNCRTIAFLNMIGLFLIILTAFLLILKWKKIIKIRRIYFIIIISFLIFIGSLLFISCLYFESITVC